MTSQDSKIKEEVKETCHHGIPMSDEELAAYEESFQEIEESIGLVMENGEDL